MKHPWFPRLPDDAVGQFRHLVVIHRWLLFVVRRRRTGVPRYSGRVPRFDHILPGHAILFYANQSWTCKQFHIMSYELFVMITKKNAQKAIQSLEFYRNIKNNEQRGLISFDGEVKRLLPPDSSGIADMQTPLTWDDFSESFIVHLKTATKWILVCVNDFDAQLLTNKQKHVFQANRGARKAFAIGMFLMFLHEFCGCFTMINYTATIFADSGSKIAPNLAAIIVAIVQLIGTMVSTKLVDRAGRKVYNIACRNNRFFCNVRPLLVPSYILIDRRWAELGNAWHLLVHERARLRRSAILLGGGD